MKKTFFVIFVILLTQEIFCEDILQKLKNTIKENSKELLKEMNQEIAKLKKAEDFSVAKMIENGIMKGLKKHKIYGKEKEIFQKIEKEFEILKNKPTLKKAERFLENILTYFKDKIPETHAFIKSVKQILTVVKSLASVAIPKPLPLPDINRPPQTPRDGDDEERRKELENRSRFPGNPPPPYTREDESRWERNGESKHCNAENCKGCCIRRQCFPEDECRYIFISRTIMAIVIMCLICCCCCGLAIGAICYFNKRRRQLELEESKRQLGRNEANAANQSPVQGIPVQQSTQGTVVVAQPDQRPGFSQLAEESTSEVQMQDLP